MRTFGMVLAAVALAAMAACCALALDLGQKAPAFKLNDQFGKTWELGALKGQVVVIVGADRDTGRSMDPWVSNLKDKYGPKITLLGLLDLHSIPGLFRGIAKSRIRNETKDPLMLDFDGKLARSYGINGKFPTVVVIDGGGVVRSTQTLAYTAAAFKITGAAIDQALQARTQT